jgi:hypothetical protein
MDVPTPRQSFDAILENTPISQEDRDRIRDRLDQGATLTPEEAYAIPGGAELREAQLQVLREPPPAPEPVAPAETAEVGLGTGEVTLPGTAEVGIGDTAEVNVPAAETAEVEAR